MCYSIFVVFSVGLSLHDSRLDSALSAIRAAQLKVGVTFAERAV